MTRRGRGKGKGRGKEGACPRPVDIAIYIVVGPEKHVDVHVLGVQVVLGLGVFGTNRLGA